MAIICFLFTDITTAKKFRTNVGWHFHATIYLFDLNLTILFEKI